jgi:RiboL-PSP-HEPN
MTNNSSISLFGIGAIDLKFDCIKCGQRVRSDQEIDVPYPDFSADTAHDSQSDNDGFAICHNCNEKYEIEVVNGYGGGWISVSKLKDDAELEIIEYPEPGDYELEAILSNSEFKNTFDSAIEKVSKLNLLSIVDKELEQLLKNNLFVSIIAAMETYLSDAFINTVDKKNEKYLRQFVDSFKKYQERKIKLSEIYLFYDNIKTDAIKELKDITFHNIEQSKYLYGKSLNVNFPNDLGNLFKIVEKRHDFVHRNGKTKDNIEVNVTNDEIENTIKQITEFINFIDEQVVQL